MKKENLIEIYLFKKANKSTPGFDYLFYNHTQNNSALGGGHLGNDLEESKEKIIKIINKNTNNNPLTIIMDSKEKTPLGSIKISKKEFFQIYDFIKTKYSNLNIKSNYTQLN